MPVFFLGNVCLCFSPYTLINSKYHPSNSLVPISAIGTFEDALQVLDHKHDVYESGWMDEFLKNLLLTTAVRLMVMAYIQ